MKKNVHCFGNFGIFCIQNIIRTPLAKPYPHKKNREGWLITFGVMPIRKPQSVENYFENGTFENLGFFCIQNMIPTFYQFFL